MYYLFLNEMTYPIMPSLTLHFSSPGTSRYREIKLCDHYHPNMTPNLLYIRNSQYTNLFLISSSQKKTPIHRLADFLLIISPDDNTLLESSQKWTLKSPWVLGIAVPYACQCPTHPHYTTILQYIFHNILLIHPEKSVRHTSPGTKTLEISQGKSRH